MDGLPVYYVMQPSEDDSINVFFLPPTLKALSDVKIRDVVTNFPHAGNGKFYHFRFHTICDKDQKSWVDISNLNARAPAVDNKIYVKILEISQAHHSKIFAAHYGAAPQNPRPPTHTSQNAREEHRSHDILNNAPQRSSQPEPQNQNQGQSYKKSVSSGDKPTPNPQTIPQQRPMTQSQQKPVQQPQSSAHDFDLLGGGDAPAENITIKSTTTTTKTTVSFGGPSETQEEKSELYGMTREQLGAYKQQKMEEAIQDKLNFANNLWQGEEQTRLGKEKAYDEVEDAIKKWSGNSAGNGQRNNIRALLCTVHQVIWQGCDWKALGLSDLMTPAQIKKSYFKAITKFHPDKNQHGDYKQKYIAERVTNELNIAWDEFRKTNP